MFAVKIESTQFVLPAEIAQKLIGRDVQLIELQDGFMVKPVSDAIKQARRFLKHRRFSTQCYFQMKQAEKGLER